MRILLGDGGLSLAEALTTLLIGAGHADPTVDGLSAETLLGPERFDLAILDLTPIRTAEAARSAQSGSDLDPHGPGSPETAGGGAGPRCR